MQTAYNRSLDALSRRSRSVKDLERWLKDREYSPEEITEAVERLTSAGLLNDERFAHSFARSRLVDRGMSKRRVSMELARHGIARELVDQVIGEVVADEGIDEDATVEAVARKKWRSLAKLEPQVGERRLMGFLARKGFDGDAVRRVVRRVTAA
jgi:regulatory protein